MDESFPECYSRGVLGTFPGYTRVKCLLFDSDILPYNFSSLNFQSIRQLRPCLSVCVVCDAGCLCVSVCSTSEFVDVCV